MQLLNAFTQVGLSEKEAECYLHLLKLGTQPASVIAKKMEIPRSTAHFHLSTLCQHQFATQSKKANTMYFIPELPQNIIKVLEREREQQIAEKNLQIDLLKKISPELLGIMSKLTSIPKITFYEGDDGLKKIYEDTLTSSETIRSMASFDAMHDALPDYFRSYYRRRAEKNVHIRSLHPDTPLARSRMKNNQAEYREAQLVNAKDFHFTPEIQCYDGKIVITSWKEKFGIFIESEEISQAFSSLFELAWKKAEQSPSKKAKPSAKPRPQRRTEKEKKKNGKRSGTDRRRS